MNKYLKILMLSGGLVGAIAPTAINMDKDKINNDLGVIYEQVEKMQEILPRLSRINYKLDIDLIDDNLNKNNTNNITESDNSLVNDSSINNDTISNNNEDDKSINTTSNNSEQNITFTTTDELGNETTLSNNETINYLNETLIQTNIEYEKLKTTLSNAIKDTMDYLDSYKNGETSLTNEQKIYIKEHSNSIKFLAETLEDLSEEIICCIDGCEECEEDFEFTSSQYLSTINELETRINALNSAIASLQFVNNIGNPYVFESHIAHNNRIYGYHNAPQEDTQQDNSTSNELNAPTNDVPNLTVDNNNSSMEAELSASNDNINEQTNNVVNNSKQDNTTTNNDNDVNNNAETDKPTTFGLKSNIDTYAPTKRNIDTFFNTALYNNEYMNGNAYGYGYGNPYYYGGGYGYGMPYGAGLGNPYGGMGLNSNVINRETIENQNEHEHETHNTNANIEQQDEKQDTQKPKKIRTKRAKNIDTYTGTTIKSNINTMGESKISRFFKEKFNNLRRKVRKQKEDIPSPIQNNDENNQSTDITEQNIIPNDNSIEKVVDDKEITKNSNNSSPALKVESIDTLEQQKDIKAKQ